MSYYELGGSIIYKQLYREDDFDIYKINGLSVFIDVLVYVMTILISA